MLQAGMASFIGYVNTLVVGSRVLEKLPTEVLTRDIIDRLDETTITQIAGLKKEDMDNRKKDLKTLDSLRRLLKVMRRHEMGRMIEPTSDRELTSETGPGGWYKLERAAER